MAFRKGGGVGGTGGANLDDLGRNDVPVLAHLSPRSRMKKLCIRENGRECSAAEGFAFFCRICLHGGRGLSARQYERWVGRFVEEIERPSGLCLILWRRSSGHR